MNNVTPPHLAGLVILMAEDDPDDRLMMREAFAEVCIRNELHFVNDGEELLEYLRKKGKYAERANERSPGLILLDLNMPRKDGREALREIKADPVLNAIPVVVFTTSKSETDIQRSYSLGASSYVVKPVTFTSLVEVIRTLGQYWFQLVELPK